MPKKYAPYVLVLLVVFLLLINACSTTPVADQAAKQPAEADAQFAQFHTIVDAAFVAEHVQAPMAENVMIIDARPRRPKYDQGHIPMAVSIPDSQFEKMTDLLPKDKDALLIFYCGGLKCPLSHKSASKAEALGYRNVKVFAEGFPGWMKVPGHYASVSPQWMQQQVDKNADMVIVDSRPKRAKYDKGHLPSAISIPFSQFDKLSDQLPADKSKSIVFYCGGLKCPLSHKSAAKAIALGYTDVKVFSEGFPAWKQIAGESVAAKTAPTQLKAGKEEGTIDHDLFKQIMNQNPESILLVDVRDKKEYSAGSLKLAVNIPVDELEDKLASLPTDKPIVFFCGTGARSGESYYMVKDLKPELKNVYYLDGELTIHKDGTFTLKKSV